MRFGLLGPLQVQAEDSGEPMVLTAARLRALLAVLLWRANQPVAVDKLAEMVWDGTPPQGAGDAIRALVMRLRRRLDKRAAARIVTRAPGYTIEVSGDELDASRFEALTQEAGVAIRARRWTEAAAAAARSLALWRGTPLVDVPSQALRDAWLPHLYQQRIQAIEWRIDAELNLGEHERLVPELRDLTARHPLREHFHAQLMLALAQGGHQAEALAAYQRARRALVGELGIEPGLEMLRLHERLLTGDTGPPAPSMSPHPPLVPRQLPAGVRHFVGRAGELKTLSGLLAQQVETSGTAAIVGIAGIGKTALAVHWAHQHINRFPDGQLYVNLRGFAPSGAAMPPAEALRRFLVAMGVPTWRIPLDSDERAALYRTWSAGRRMLILLDNARDAEQVRWLLPGAPGCLVLATSRDQLAELTAIDGAVPVTLDPLTEREAHDLLGRRLGSGRLAAEEQAVHDLIQACEGLPLTLNIAAARAALDPARPLSQLVDVRGLG